jgi:hypothetical protein
MNPPIITDHPKEVPVREMPPYMATDLINNPSAPLRDIDNGGSVAPGSNG